MFTCLTWSVVFVKDESSMLTCCEVTRPRSSQHREIEETAHRKLRKSPYLAVRRVLCRFDRGTLVLRGNVPSFHQKQIAQRR